MAAPYMPQPSDTRLPYLAGGNAARLFLAAIVVFNHLGGLTGLYKIGAFNADLAVEGFFVLSGFAMMHSYDKLASRFHQKATSVFYIQRFFRIVVTVWALLLCQVICLFPISSLSLAEYLGTDLFTYVLVNALLLNNLQQELPGVFEQIQTQVVNGSLWTMKVEMAFYLLFPWLYHILGKRKGLLYMLVVVVASVVYRIVLTESRPGWSVQTPGQLMFFGLGMLLYRYFYQIRYQKAIAWLGILFLLKSMIWGIGLVESFFTIPVIAYGLCFSFKSIDGVFKRYDYSFTIYLLHWPIILAGVDLFIRFGRIWEGIAFIVLVLVAGSWFFHRYMEQPIMALGKKVGNKMFASSACLPSQ